ncbi:MAG: hypothetical protein HKP52_03510 [Desulfofustis sp.]|nr:hypothetical protein [Desulfofustis sp.]
MEKTPRIGHLQRRILQALYDHAYRNNVDWVSRSELLVDLDINNPSGQASFSRAITRLNYPSNCWGSFPPYIEIGHEQDYESAFIRAEQELTEDDRERLYRLEVDGRRRYYRITNHGIERFDSLSVSSRRKPH